jgi:hypothetical protein
VDKSLGLFGNPIEEVILAQCQLVLAHMDHGFLTAFPAFHRLLLKVGERLIRAS